MGDRPSDVPTSLEVNERHRMDVDRFCAGSNPPQNGLEERLDMIAAQLSVIALELHRMNDERQDS